ncbi:hypothetical protein [Nonlabens xiamenensis]|uniref:hypothetical protein n=1 Tax=Nonlabens xiamenensis TaxID=2341043 RepID=UPI000F61164A|nr:hypothetical protein [Nonlabens xiamenensis]
MKSCLFGLLAILCSQLVIAQANEAYLVTRSTAGKRNFIAADFNLKDKYSTHIGIGIKQNDVIQIYHVNVGAAPGESALQKEDMLSFISDAMVEYYTIYKIKLPHGEADRLNLILKKWEKKFILFDHDFRLGNGLQFYCSEFVKLVLEEVNPVRFAYLPIRKPLTNFYANALRRKELVYIPVDFFLNMKDVVMVQNFNKHRF